MNQRRNIGNAMTLTPEAANFIAGKAAPKPTDAVLPIAIVAEPSAIERTPEPDPELRPRATASPKKRKGVETSVAAHNSFVGELLVPLTTRIQPATANALRRAFLEQKLRHSKPDTQQDIVEEALTAWLSRNGFLA